MVDEGQTARSVVRVHDEGIIGVRPDFLSHRHRTAGSVRPARAPHACGPLRLREIASHFRHSLPLSLALVVVCLARPAISRGAAEYPFGGGLVVSLSAPKNRDLFSVDQAHSDHGKATMDRRDAAGGDGGGVGGAVVPERNRSHARAHCDRKGKQPNTLLSSLLAALPKDLTASSLFWPASTAVLQRFYSLERETERRWDPPLPTLVLAAACHEIMVALVWLYWRAAILRMTADEPSRYCCCSTHM